MTVKLYGQLLMTIDVTIYTSKRIMMPLMAGHIVFTVRSHPQSRKCDVKLVAAFK